MSMRSENTNKLTAGHLVLRMRAFRRSKAFLDVEETRGQTLRRKRKAGWKPLCRAHMEAL